MGREYRIQSALAPVFPYVATMVGLCDDESVIGSDFYVMERLDGIILRRDLRLACRPTTRPRPCASTRSTCWSTCTPSTSWRIARPRRRSRRGEGYVARQVAGWTDRFARARTDDTGDWSDITAWLDAQQPADVAQRLIHNDFRFDNMVLDADDPLRVVGVLDWEMATVGDPLMDLGGMLAYWVEEGDDEFFQMFRRQPTTAPGMWTRDRVVEHYCDRMGFAMTPERWRFYEVFGLFRLAVIAQQIWYRYVHRQTTNEAYAVFGPAVGVPRDPVPPAGRPGARGRLMGVVLLVRHGQASFGADDYDVLSETGWEQCRLLGAHLAARGSRPTSWCAAGCAGTARPPRACSRARGWSVPRRASTRAGTSSTTSASSRPTPRCRDPRAGPAARPRPARLPAPLRARHRALDRGRPRRRTTPSPSPSFRGAGPRRADPRLRAGRPRRHRRRGQLRRPDRARACAATLVDPDGRRPGADCRAGSGRASTP